MDQSDQLTVVEDSAAVASSRDTTAAASPSVPVTDQFGEKEELCLLPEKSLDVGDLGGDLDDLGDPSDLGREVPNKEEEKPGTLPPRQEEDTSKGRFGVKFWWCDSQKFPQEVIAICMWCPMFGCEVTYCW